MLQQVAIIFGIFASPILVVVLYILIRLSYEVLSYNMKKKHYSHLHRFEENIPLIHLFKPKQNNLKKIIHRTLEQDGTLKAEMHFLGPHLDGTPTCFIVDSDLFRDLFNVEQFAKLKLVYNPLKQLIGDGLVTSSGSIWKRERRLLTPLFHFSKLKQMPDIMNNQTEKFCAHLRSLNGKPVKVVSEFGSLSLDIVVDCVFGGERYIKTSTMHSLWEKATAALRTYFLTSFLLGESVNKVLPFPGNTSVKSTMKELLAMVDLAIERKKIDLAEEDCSEDSDLLASLLAVKDEITGEPIRQDLIRDEALTFLFAGHDTTSSLLSWVMTFLVRYPDVVDKLREEISQVLGNRTRVEFEDIKKFKYCETVLKETLRMRPPVPLLSRQATTDYQIGGTLIKKGTYCYMLFLASHYDKRHWKEPFEFRPDRFAKENRESEPSANAFSFTPFSAGSRNCVGKKFALTEAILALVHVIRDFDVVTDVQEEDIHWDIEGTLKPVNFYCSFIPRENKN
mmetsp:Transcript_109293/g.163466  ORF Transcript_109293/g.163466 Transcript_109293/m.163466 type:complete len:508 (-) Transcript_109293:18-1541(-)